MVKRISLERELALWKGGKPLGPDETETFRALIERHKGAVEGLSCTDREVAYNSVEIKFSLIGKDSFRASLIQARCEIERLASERGYSVIWTNQPLHKVQGHNEYFTTMAFPELVAFLVHGNSLHIHFETGPEDAFRAYRQMNALAPWFILNSRHRNSVIDRVDLVRAFRGCMGELFLPQLFTSDAEYSEYMARSSETVQKRLMESGNYDKARAMFGRMFPADGHISLTPDKVFHPARYRPDLLLPNGNLSVEFRGLDGIPEQQRELSMVETAVAVYDAALGEPDIMPMSVLRRFYDELSASSRAYKIADEFIQETMKKTTGSYLEAVNDRA